MHLHTQIQVFARLSQKYRAARSTRFLAVYSQPQLFYDTHYPRMFTQLILVTSVYSTIFLPTSATKPILVL